MSWQGSVRIGLLALVAAIGTAVGCDGDSQVTSTNFDEPTSVSDSNGSDSQIGLGPPPAARAFTIPFDDTGDALVVEPSTGNILNITPGGVVSIALSRDAIQAVTGRSDVNLDRKGIAVDGDDGTAYFAEQDSGALLKFPIGGPLSILARRSAFVTAAGGVTDHFNLGTAFSSDGFLYVTSKHSGPGEEEAGGTGLDRIFKVNRTTGNVTLFTDERAVESALPGTVISYDTEQAIVGGDGGRIYVANTNSADPPGVIAFASDGTPSALNVGTDFSTRYRLRAITRDADGNLIVRDDAADKFIKVVTSNGAASDFLTEAVLDAIGADPDGGMAFASDGTFYVADDDLGILRFPPPYTSGTVWVSAQDIVAVTGGSLEEFNLNGGIAFKPLTVVSITVVESVGVSDTPEEESISVAESIRASDSTTLTKAIIVVESVGVSDSPTLQVAEPTVTPPPLTDSISSSFTIIAYTDTAIPFRGNLTGFGRTPSIDDAGNVVFCAIGGSGQQGIYTHISGLLGTVADGSTLLPGQSPGGDTFTSFGGPGGAFDDKHSIDNGNVAFQANIQQGPGALYALFTTSGDSLVEVARADSTVGTGP